MSYSEIENEHHEEISSAIVQLRNEVEKLWLSERNQRGQALACEDDYRARSLYESSAAYADAARRVAQVSQQFDELESFRAGAMEAIGPVQTRDELEAELAAQTRFAVVSGQRAQWLESQISALAETLGAVSDASTEDVIGAADNAVKTMRRFQGIREHAMKIITDQASLGQLRLDTLVDVVTVLLDGDHPEQLKRIRIALGADVPDVVVPGPLKLELPEGLLEQFRRVARKEPAEWSTSGYQPTLGELVTGYDVTDVDGETLTGKVTFVDDAVTIERPRYRSVHGWYLSYASLDRTELRAANAQEVAAYEWDRQLVQEQNASLPPEVTSPEGEWKIAQGTQLDLTPAKPWGPMPGQIVTVPRADDGERVPVQFVALNMANPYKAIVQLPGELQTADGVDHVWESREVDVTDLAPALPDQVNAFTAELEAKGLDGTIR